MINSFRLFRSSNQTQALSLIEKLNMIRPSNEEPSGNCLACAEQTMKVLADAKYSPEVISKKSTIRNESDVLTKEIFASDQNQKEISNGDTESFWQCIKDLPEGAILLVNQGDDHYFNFVKTNQGKLFLLDSDYKLYQEIRHINDLEHSGYSYFRKLEDVETNSLVFYTVGKLDPVWDQQLQKLTHNCVIL